MSKTNVKMSKPSFIVKRDDGVIICKITAESNAETFKNLDLYEHALAKKLKKRLGIWNIGTPVIFTAVVRHHKSDIWNELVGKRIAEAKCKRSIYSFYYKVHKLILDEIKNSDIAQLERYAENLEHCRIREDKHYKDLMG